MDPYRSEVLKYVRTPLIVKVITLSTANNLLRMATVSQESSRQSFLIKTESKSARGTLTLQESLRVSTLHITSLWVEQAAWALITRKRVIQGHA